MALVDEQGKYFYEVLPCPQPIPWVQENVMPKLNQAAISPAEFKGKLGQFLRRYDQLHIIADWPEDLALFSRALIVGFGKCMVIPPLTMQLWMDKTVQLLPEIPHNALSDANELRQAYLEQYH